MHLENQWSDRRGRIIENKKGMGKVRTGRIVLSF
jgi:hypothetical protein